MGMAKIRKAQIQKLKAQPNRKLLGAYWGYHPKNDNVEFEFSNYHLFSQGVPYDKAEQIVQSVYKAVQKQLALVETLSPEEQVRFIDQEEQRLIQVAHDLKNAGRMVVEEYVRGSIIGACAVSTLVAAGRLQQDNLNGDSFAFA
jgi:hypothetical protein